MRGLRQKAAEAHVGRIVSFGEQAEADARVLQFALQPDCSTVQASVLGAEVTYKLGAPGRHLVLNSLAVLGRGDARRRRSRAGGAGARRTGSPPRAAARASRSVCRAARAADRRELQRQSGLDARGAGAARPGDARPARAAHRRARRHARARCRWRAAAPRTGGSRHRQQRRPGVLLRSADAAFVGGSSLRTPGRLCRTHPRRSNADARARCSRRRGDGQGLARLAHGPARQGAGTPVTPIAALLPKASAQG